MLEGTVARLLNQLLGKYVVDLDTENLNVGIFSGQVQLNDLKLKPEALVSIQFYKTVYYLPATNTFPYYFGLRTPSTTSTMRHRRILGK